MLGFLSHQGKLIYYSTTDTVTTGVVIAAFDHFIIQKSPDTFAIVAMDKRAEKSAGAGPPASTVCFKVLRLLFYESKKLKVVGFKACRMVNKFRLT